MDMPPSRVSRPVPASRAGGAGQVPVPGTTTVGAWSRSVVSGGPRFRNQTIRMVAHSTVEGSAPRIRLSNLYGAAPLRVGAVGIALRDGRGRAVPGTRRAVTIGGCRDVALPAGAELLSDPVDLRVEADTTLLISLYLPDDTGPSTWHPFAAETSYLAAGDHVDDDGDEHFHGGSESIHFVSGVTLDSATASGTLVAMGDSITDGVRSTSGANLRWPDILARRVGRNGIPLSVVNAGISGNRLLTDHPELEGGPAGLARFRHDALDLPQVRSVITMLGVNDIIAGVGPQGTVLTARALVDGYRSLIDQARSRGVRMIGGTILPFAGTAAQEAIRAEVNRWIRTSGAFDATVDFAIALRDPESPASMLPAFDCGDRLHPSDAGMRAIAGAVELSELGC